MSQPNDNVLIVPSRNVLLTRARWGVGNGPTRDDPEGARPAGGAEESQKETDYAAASGGRDRSQRTPGAAHATEAERARRQGGDSRGPWGSVESEDYRASGTASDRDPKRGSVSGFRTDTGGRVSGKETQPAGRQGDAAWVDEQSQTMAYASEEGRKSPHLANAAQSLRRAGAMGYQRTRLAGRPRPQAVPDQHDRRRDQPHASALCGARLNPRESAPVAELSGEER